MPTIRLKRHGRLDLVFEGELIASSTSDDGTKDRWQSYTLYRKNAGGYVLERLGETRVEGEITMRYVDEFPNPHRVVNKIRRKRDNGEYYFTVVALDLLDEAAENDERFANEAVERVT